MSRAPSERKLAEVERRLGRSRPGAQLAVGGGIYMRLTRDGSRRFQYRVRNGNGGQPAGTFGSWEEAAAARERAESEAEPSADGQPSATQMRDWTIERYGREAWWPKVELECDALTQLDYRRGFEDLLPHISGVTLARLDSSPLLIDQIRQKLAQAKTYQGKGETKARLRKAAADKPLKVLRLIGTDAAGRDVLSRNPAAGVKMFNRQRSAASDGKAPSHRPILQSEVKRPQTVALAAAGMRGDPLTILRRRTIPELIEIGMRPSDIMSMRNYWWRDENGPLALIHVDAAVKDLAGHLVEGEPKTGERDLYLFAAVGEQLERIYELAGAGDLNALTFPNENGGLLDWGNWRQQAWYPALHRSGIAEAAAPKAKGAFWPYILRHVGVTVMLHAERPEGGTYSEREAARQFGHTVQTLDRVYADIPKDMHGIAGMTMDEIIRNARREIWGPMPGDADYQEIEYELLQAEELTGLSRTALAGRLQRGTLPGVKRDRKWYITRFDLQWHGLVARETR